MRKERIVEFNWLFLDDDDDDSEESEHKNVCIMRMHEMHLSLQFNNSRFVVSMIAMAIYFHSWLELSSWPRFFYFKKYTYIAAALSVHCFLFSLWSPSLTLAPFLVDSIALLIKLIEIKCCHHHHRKEN